MSLTEMKSPWFTAAPLSVSVPPVGSELIFTACRLFGRVVVDIAEAEVARPGPCRSGSLPAAIGLVGAAGLVVDERRRSAR